MSYHGAQVKVEPQHAAEGDPDAVVARDVHIRHERLPTAANRHTCKNSKR